MADTDSAISHFECISTGETFDLDFSRFPVHGRILDPQYDYDAVDVTRETWERRSGSVWKYRELLPPVDDEHVVSMGEGETPLVPGRRLTDELDVGRLWVKDEGQNPTSTFKDRGATASISGALQHGATEVGMATAGNAGQAASAYAAAAGLDCHVWVPRQAGSVQRSLIGVHGATVHEVDGKLPDAIVAFEDALEASGLYSVATFQTPYRHQGKKTMGLELFEQLEWQTPDHVVYPTGGGVGLLGIWNGYRDLVELGWLDDDSMPTLHVTQPRGNAPLVRALQDDAREYTAWKNPETVARGVEVPDPGTSSWVLDAVTTSGGTGVSVSDEEAIEAARQCARLSGVEPCIEAGIAFAGTAKLSADGVIGSDDEVVVVNTGAGTKSADLLGEE